MFLIANLLYGQQANFWKFLKLSEYAASSHSGKPDNFLSIKAFVRLPEQKPQNLALCFREQRTVQTIYIRFWLSHIGNYSSLSGNQQEKNMASKAHQLIELSTTDFVLYVMPPEIMGS